MSVSFHQNGAVVDVTALSDIVGGQVIDLSAYGYVSGLIGVASTDFATGVLASAQIVGVFKVSNDAGVAAAAGADALFDLTTQALVASGGVSIGKYQRTLLATDSDAYVILNDKVSF